MKTLNTNDSSVILYSITIQCPCSSLSVTPIIIMNFIRTLYPEKKLRSTVFTKFRMHQIVMLVICCLWQRGHNDITL